MKRLFYISLLIFTSAISAFAQNDWHTYPARPIADIIKAESSEDSEMGAIIISAAPFSSKTKVTYTGKSRSIGKYTKDFIGLWVQTRNVPTENANMLA
ncbi:MAG: hypothetical protein ABI954_15820 [Pyrinomonadaceae bacterium]